MILQQRLEGGEGGSHLDFWGRTFPGGGNKFKDLAWGYTSVPRVSEAQEECPGMNLQSNNRELDLVGMFPQSSGLGF